jgi:hypothetical protein
MHWWSGPSRSLRKPWRMPDKLRGYTYSARRGFEAVKLDRSVTNSNAASTALWLFHRGSYTSPLTQKRCSNIASFRAATTARFFASFPARSASFNPQRRRSLSSPKGPNMLGAPCTSSFSDSGAVSPSLLMMLSRVAARTEELRAEPQIHTESVWVFDSQNIGQRDLRSDTLHLLEQRSFRVALLRDLLDAAVVFFNAPV